MSTEPYSPQLVLTAIVRSRPDSYNFSDYLSAISMLFEILSDLGADNMSKFAAGGFPFTSIHRRSQVSLGIRTWAENGGVDSHTARSEL